MYLEDIVRQKRVEVASLTLLERKRWKGIIDPVASLAIKPFIAEVKRASPSMGGINPGIDIVHQAKLYERGGAGAVSVLTDEKFFMGSIDFLSSISDNVSIPTLCKDFILSDIQIDNAHAAGGDCILLIAAILDENELASFSKRARTHGMKVLYELHTIDEFEKIRKLDLELVGVNARDLKTFSIDREHAANVISMLKGDFLRVAESGICDREDIRTYRSAGADAFLVGTVLMKAPDPEAVLKEFYSVL